LANLSKTGGVSAISYSLAEFKNYEESTLKNALNSLINSTIQESEVHKEFAQHLQSYSINPIADMKKDLSTNKRAWIAKIDSLKKQVKEYNETFRKNHMSF
jgi:hypothetical protein